MLGLPSLLGLLELITLYNSASSLGSLGSLGSGAELRRRLQVDSFCCTWSPDETCASCASVSEPGGWCDDASNCEASCGFWCSAQDPAGADFGVVDPGAVDAHHSAEACVDTDNGAVGRFSYTCATIGDRVSKCTGYDNDDFVAAQMCCVCGGGRSSAVGGSMETAGSVLPRCDASRLGGPVHMCAELGRGCESDDCEARGGSWREAGHCAWRLSWPGVRWRGASKIDRLDDIDYSSGAYLDSIYDGCDLSAAEDQKIRLEHCTSQDFAGVCSALCAAYSEGGTVCQGYELKNSDECSLHDGVTGCSVDDDCSGSDRCLSGFCAQSSSSRDAGVPAPVIAEPSSSPCVFSTGDGLGGTESYAGDVATADACAELVLAEHPSANGATYSNSGGADCYAEFGMTSQDSSSGWQTCLFEASEPSTSDPAAGFCCTYSPDGSCSSCASQSDAVWCASQSNCKSDDAFSIFCAR